MKVEVSNEFLELINKHLQDCSATTASFEEKILQLVKGQDQTWAKLDALVKEVAEAKITIHTTRTLLYLILPVLFSVLLIVVSEVLL